MRLHRVFGRFRSHHHSRFSINVPQQAFLDVSSAVNPALSYGTSGILGLGFTSLSTVDALVNRTGASSGRSLLYNLFNDNPTEPNFIAFSLQRSSDPTDDIEGTFLIGEVEPEYAAVNKTTAIPTFPVNSPTRWTVLLDAVFVGTNTISVTTTVANAPSNRAVVLVDSGTSYTYVLSYSYLPIPHCCSENFQLRSHRDLRGYLWRYHWSQV